MANRRLYGSRSFVVEQVLEFDNFEKVWHLLGRFTEGSVVSKHDRQYRVRVSADSRWRGVRQVSFRGDSVWESESIYRVTRRHIYGSGQWYISPRRIQDERFHYGKVMKGVKEAFDFEDFEVVATA